MKKSKKIIFILIGGLGIVLTILVLLIFVTFLIVNTGPIQERILAFISHQSSNVVKIDNIALSLFPRPRISIFNMKITIPETVAGTIKTIRIYPKLIPLLTGKIIISRVVIDVPDFNVKFYEKLGKNDNKTVPNLLGEIETELAPPTAFLLSIAPNLRLQLNRGRLVFRDGNRDLATIQNISGRFGLLSNGLDMSVTGDTKRWGPFSAEGHIVIDENAILVKELSASAGRSSVTGFSGRFRWQTTPVVEVLSGKGIIDLEYWYKHRESFEGIRDFTRSLKELKGTLRLTEMGFEGPILHPNDWKMKTNGEIDGVQLDSTLFPSAVTITNGQFSATTSDISLTNLQGHLLNSSISEFSARVEWKSVPYFQITSGKALIDLESVFNQRHLIPLLENSFKNVTGIKGRIRLKDISFSGLFQHPEEWRLEASGDFQNIIVDSVELPGPLYIPTGQFIKTNNSISLNNLKVKFIGSILSGSGKVSGSLSNVQSAQISIKGELSQSTIRWASKLFELSPSWTLRGPFELILADLTWERGGKLSLAGSGDVKQGPEFSIDLQYNLKQLLIRKCFVQDKDSDVTLALKQINKEFDVIFSGTLDNRTLRRLFEQNPYEFGWIRGNFKTHLPLESLRDFSANGSLEAKDIVIPIPENIPVRVSHVLVKANGRSFSIASGTFSWEKMNYDLTGNVESEKDHVLLDIAISSDGFNINSFLKESSGEMKGSFSAWVDLLRDRLKNLPVQGIIRLTTPYISYDRFSLTSVKADISLEPSVFNVTLLEAKYCGISITGHLKSAFPNTQLKFRPKAVNQPIENTFSCLAGTDIQMSGTFNLTGDIMNERLKDPLDESFHGTLSFTAKNGKINRFLLLARILSLLNFTDILKAKLPNLETNGLLYDSIKIKGTLKNGKLKIEEGTLSGPTVNMASQGDINLSDRNLNLTILVAPFKSINDIVYWIPLVKSIFGSTLISVPVQVTGNLENPTVIPLSPVAIGKDVLGIMGRVLELPFKVIDGINPEKKGAPH